MEVLNSVYSCVRFSSKIQLNVHFPIVSIIRMIFQLFNVKIRHGMFFGTRQKHIFVDFAWQVFSIDQIVTQELVGNTRQLFATTYWCGLKREREVNPSICSRNFLLSFSWRKKIVQCIIQSCHLKFRATLLLKETENEPFLMIFKQCINLLELQSVDTQLELLLAYRE